MIPFYSKRNQVYPTLYFREPAVEKHFRSLESWRRETVGYAVLKDRLALPRVLHSEPGVLITEYHPFPTLLSELDRQERAGYCRAPWQALALWLQTCCQVWGRIPGEGNLRNFLWDPKEKRIVGIDLEDYREGTLVSCGAEVAAAIREYFPANTELKRRAAGVIADLLRVPDPLLETAQKELKMRRASVPVLPSVTGIILAGGKSSRMGKDKAGLKIDGKTLLQWQMEKMQALGMEEILISGSGLPCVSGAREVEDVYPNRGPLGGLHACLGAAKTQSCLVVSVDVPLIPTAALHHLRRAHRAGITVLQHKGMQEPLIGMYDKNVHATVSSLVEQGTAPVRELQKHGGWSTWDYLGPEELLTNCNTREELSFAAKLALDFRGSGLQGLL